MRNDAIIGAGFCGLAVAWHLLQREQPGHVTIFDPAPIGTTTSGIAAGLLHPFAGAHAKKNWKAEAGIAASLELFEVAKNALGQSIASSTGLLRLALTEMQNRDFSLCQKKYFNEVHWYSAEDCQQKVAGLLPLPGIFIDQCLQVDCQNYLKGLWKALSMKGVERIETRITSLEDLNAFDHVIITAGALTTLLPQLETLPLGVVKGQLLEIEWPESIPPLIFPINSQGYLLMSPDKKRCIAGATFEKNYLCQEADIQKAIEEILPKIHAFFPHLLQKHLITGKAGLRSTTPDHLPLLQQISNRCWVLAGMGSKGLLYHALYAKELSRRIAK